MSEKKLVPETFGPLQGVKIVSTGTLIAQPFAAELAAEMGAEVIQVERPRTGDESWRNVGIQIKAHDGGDPVATTFVQERRNMFCVGLDMSKPRGRDILLKLLQRAEIWMESSKPGTYAKWGLDDETVLKANPSLVITHVSGYGQTGDPDYVGRTSYDMIGQAFGGRIVRAPQPIHGKASRVKHDGRGIFAGVPEEIEVGRYHSLVIEPESCPQVLEVTARTADGVIMAVRHRSLPIEGVQFHPESVLTSYGMRLLSNFVELCRAA